MCAVCSEWEKGKLTSKEALDIAGEILLDLKNDPKTKHMLDLVDKILEKELQNENS